MAKSKSMICTLFIAVSLLFSSCESTDELAKEPTQKEELQVLTPDQKTKKLQDEFLELYGGEIPDFVTNFIQGLLNEKMILVHSDGNDTEEALTQSYVFAQADSSATKATLEKAGFVKKDTSVSTVEELAIENQKAKLMSMFASAVSGEKRSVVAFVIGFTADHDWKIHAVVYDYTFVLDQMVDYESFDYSYIFPAEQVRK